MLLFFENLSTVSDHVTFVFVGAKRIQQVLMLNWNEILQLWMAQEPPITEKQKQPHALQISPLKSVCIFPFSDQIQDVILASKYMNLEGPFLFY